MINYIFKKFSKIPFVVVASILSAIWAYLCGMLGLFIILSKANFQATGTEKIFVLSWLIYMILAGLFSNIEWGLLRLFGIKIEDKQLRVLNDNIIKGRISPVISNRVLKEVFRSLTLSWIKGTKVAARYIWLVISLTLLTEWLASGQLINLPIILLGGSISFLLAILYVPFFKDHAVYSVVKECKALLDERKIEVEEPHSKISLRYKFVIFFLLPIFIVLIILSCFSFEIHAIVFACLGLVMAAILSQLLSSIIYRAFSEIQIFIKKLPKKKRVFFSSGSLESEILDMSKNLNQAANEIYVARRETEKKTKEVEKSYQEIKKRKDELEKFYNLTIGRELKMVELKKEIKKLKERLAKKAKK